MSRPLWRRLHRLQPIVADARGPSSAARRRAAPTAPAALPVATEIRLAGDDKETRLVIDLTRDARHPRLHARRSLSGGDRHSADRVPAAAGVRRDRPRAGQGLSLRPRDGGRLAHRDRCRPSRCGSKRRPMLDAAGRPAGAAGARSVGDRPRSLHAPSRARPHRARAERQPARRRRRRPSRPAIRAR